MIALVQSTAWAAEHWQATSTTAMSITGNITLAPGKITFATGKSLPLAAPVPLPGFRAEGRKVAATLYKVTTPADLQLIRETACVMVIRLPTSWFGRRGPLAEMWLPDQCHRSPVQLCRPRTTVQRLAARSTMRSHVFDYTSTKTRGAREVCNDPALFRQSDDKPFLEVHHVRLLADGGPDTADNAIATCPTSHHELHMASGKRRLAHLIQRTNLRSAF